MDGYVRIARENKQQIVWDIYTTEEPMAKYHHRDKCDKWVPDYRARLRDGKRMPRGLNKIVFKSDDDGYTAEGYVEVTRYGRFVDPEHVVGTISDMRDAVGYWGRYIEGFRRDADGDINVIIGS
jgi:hypothetical protein